MKTILTKILLLSIVILASCTKVIDVDLNDADPSIVIDGSVQLSETDGNNMVAEVLVNWTSSYFEPNEFEAIDGASLYIKDGRGQTYKLEEISTGFYYNDQLPVGTPKEEYELYGTIEEEEVSARSTLSRMVLLDSVGADQPNFGPPWISPFCYFTDIPGEDNYYRLRVFVNGFHDKSIFFINDSGRDGMELGYRFFGVEVIPGDSISIELLCIDEDSYEYYKVLSEATGSAAPGNPTTNIVGEGIGVFTAETMSQRSHIVVE